MPDNEPNRMLVISWPKKGEAFNPWPKHDSPNHLPNACTENQAEFALKIGIWQNHERKSRANATDWAKHQT